jgi:hypothetical protein
MAMVKYNVWPATILGLAVVALVAFALWYTKDLLAFFGLFGLLAPVSFIECYDTEEYEEEYESSENDIPVEQNDRKETQAPYEGSIF